MKKIRPKRGNCRGIPARISPELYKLIKSIQMKAYMNGKRMPSTHKVTELMSKKWDKEDLYNEFYFKF